MKSLENELKGIELSLGRERDLTSKYKDIVKELNDVLPLLVGLEGIARKRHCITVLSALAKIRIHSLPALEKDIRELRNAISAKYKLRNFNRSDEATKKIYDNFEKNIKNKKP